MPLFNTKDIFEIFFIIHQIHQKYTKSTSEESHFTSQQLSAFKMPIGLSQAPNKQKHTSKITVDTLK